MKKNFLSLFLYTYIYIYISNNNKKKRQEENDQTHLGYPKVCLSTHPRKQPRSNGDGTEGSLKISRGRKIFPLRRREFTTVARRPTFLPLASPLDSKVEKKEEKEREREEREGREQQRKTGDPCSKHSHDFAMARDPTLSGSTFHPLPSRPPGRRKERGPVLNHRLSGWLRTHYRRPPYQFRLLYAVRGSRPPPIESKAKKW